MAGPKSSSAAKSQKTAPSTNATRSQSHLKLLNTSQLPKNFNYLLEKLEDIPTLPIVATQINELINDPNSSASDIAEVMKKDQVLTAKVLKLINSPYYGIPGGVTNVQRALAFLGFNTIAQLVLGLSVFSLFPDDGSEDFSIIQFWRHALATAVGSEVIAKQIKYNKPEECFTCGLLHDIGKVVLHQIAKKQLIEIVTAAKAVNCGFVDIERDRDLPGHGFLGEFIAAKWGLPHVIRGTIRYHHFDVREINTLLPGMKVPIQIVSLANALAVNMNIGHSGDYSDGGLKPYMHTVLDINDTQLEYIREKIKEETTKASTFLTINS